MYIFLDESGDLGLDIKKLENKSSSPFFAITILVCDNSSEFFSFKTAVKRTLSVKFNRNKTKNLITELKGINTTIQVKQFFYKQLLKRKDQEWKIYSIVVDKYQLAKKANEYINPHRLYNLLSREIIERVNFSNLTSDIQLIVDKCKGGRERAAFDYYLKTHFEPKLPLNISLTILHELSHNNAGLQAVDLFGHGIMRKHALNDISWYSLFADKIVDEIRWIPKFE